MWISRHKKLRNAGLLGLNERNVSYISRYNKRQNFPLVDNKLKTKKAATAVNLPVPELLGVIASPAQLKTLPTLLKGHQSFVIKPARGSGGKGILVVSGRREDAFFKPSGAQLTKGAIRHYVSNILSGVYSLGGKPDVALIETLVSGDHLLGKYSHEGLPDIRIIVFQGFPVMAMLRCPTSDSDGKANLHQGAVGVGLDITTGTALKAVQNDKIISSHPDTGVKFADLAIPNWRKLLQLAGHCHDFTELGYLGCDIVLDKERGPLILEVNARPGLFIQIASGVGLRSRLQNIENLVQKDWHVDERIDYALKHFATAGKN
ncbi:MAG: alpha-L-glutamate ligase-like protein [Gammaproteobacteria bacterium]|nr:alpha-L-glutamate ligase-like protein [Gammaproteobacteria bacterium]MBQ0840884.1 alpha-L-glutamate ligase-like protein [Gammaproteobacteria bacterium]